MVIAALAVTALALAPAAGARAALAAKLRVSDRSPRQGHGVLLDASRSKGEGISAYVFEYGDGMTNFTYQPLALHGYRRPGTYRARVTVVGAKGARATSTRVTIRVRDGLAPSVRIDSPRPGQRARSGLLLRGQARDRGGVRRVELAIQLRATRGRPVIGAGGRCVWYAPRRGLVLTPCYAPYFFAVTRVGRTHWRFRVPGRPRLPDGTYGVRVRATDRAGNVSHFFAERLRTILAFRVVR